MTSVLVNRTRVTGSVKFMVIAPAGPLLFNARVAAAVRRPLTRSDRTMKAPENESDNRDDVTFVGSGLQPDGSGICRVGILEPGARSGFLRRPRRREPQLRLDAAAGRR